MNTPNAASQRDVILNLLKQGKRLTTHDMNMMFIQSPTARIKELRDMGYPIKADVAVSINQFKRKSRYNVYYMD